MTITTINTKFSVGDVCYVTIHPTADILQCVVNYVRADVITAAVTYRVTRVEVNQTIDYLNESDIYTFDEAKAELLSWLADQTSRVTLSVEPPYPSGA